MVIVLVICLGICFGNFRMEHAGGFPFWYFQNISPNISQTWKTYQSSTSIHGIIMGDWENVDDFHGDFMRRWVPFGVHHDFKRWFRLVLLMGISLGYVGKLIITIAYSWVWHFEKNWIFWNLFQTVIDSGNDGALGNRNMGECSCCSKKLWE